MFFFKNSLHATFCPGQVGDDNLYYQVVATAHSCVPVSEQLFYKNTTKTGSSKLDE